MPPPHWLSSNANSRLKPVLTLVARGFERGEKYPLEPDPDLPNPSLATGKRPG
jgi:hypothetical protein